MLNDRNLLGLFKIHANNIDANSKTSNAELSDLTTEIGFVVL